MNTWSRNSFSTSQEQIQHLHSVKMRRHFPTSPWNTKLGEHIATRNVGGGEGIWVIFRVWFFFPHHVILITSKQQSRTRTGMIASGANTDLSLPLFLYSLCLSLSFPLMVGIQAIWSQHKLYYASPDCTHWDYDCSVHSAYRCSQGNTKSKFWPCLSSIIQEKSGLKKVHEQLT